MAFKTLETEFAFSPDVQGDFVMGRIVGLKAMDNKPNVQMLLIQTSRPVVDEKGVAVMVDGTDGEGKPTKTPKTEKAIARVIDFDLIRSVQTEIPDFKRYDSKGAGARFALVECIGFDGSANNYPRYSASIGGVDDMKEELVKRNGVALVLHPRVNKKAAKAAGGDNATTGAATGGGDDDIPF